MSAVAHKAERLDFRPPAIARISAAVSDLGLLSREPLTPHQRQLLAEVVVAGERLRKAFERALEREARR